MKALASQQRLQSETSVADFIPYAHHVTPTILATHSGDYLSVWHLGGRHHQSVDAQTVFSWSQELNNVLRGISRDGVSFYTHLIRRRMAQPAGLVFDNLFCQHLDERYRASFADQPLMVNDLYLTVLLSPATSPLFKLWRRPAPDRDQVQQQQQARIKVLDDINRTLATALRRYDAQLLSLYQQGAQLYSAPAAALAQLINGEYRPLPVLSQHMSHYMAFNRPLFSTWGELGEVRTRTGARRFGMLEITDYSDHTAPGQLNILLESPGELTLTQSFAPLSQAAAKGFLQRHKQQLIDAQDVAYSQIDAIDDALNQLIAGGFIMGHHHASVLVWGDSAQEVRDHLARNSAALLDVGLISKATDLALECAFWAQLPGNWSYRPRPTPITSLNFLSFSSFHNFMGGKPTGNPWGPAVTLFKTTSGTPLYFNFHASPPGIDVSGQRLLGNTVMIGKSGTGKTVLLSFLLAQAQQYQPTIVSFDKDRGMEIIIRALGGCYLPLKMGLPSGFNPLQLAPTPANRLFLQTWLQQLVSPAVPLNAHDEQLLTHALDTLLTHLPLDQRRLSVLVQSLPNPVDDDPAASPSLHARLQRWCQGGAYGWLFDNPTDVLDLTQHHIYGFDITEFLDHPDTRGPTLQYLIHRTEAMLDGRRFIYVFDEFWKALADPGFEALAHDKLKTIRKQNGIFVFATQEPSDALNSPIAKTLVQQCATALFLPNPQADYDDYTQGFKLTPVEFDLIKNLGEDSRQFVIKQGRSVAVAQFDLQDGQDLLSVLSGSPDRAQQLEQLRAEVGDNPAQWLPRWLEAATVDSPVSPHPPSPPSGDY